MGKESLTSSQIKQIIYLRGRGNSLPEIRRITRHGNGTIFKYIREVEILPKFQELWRNKRKSSIFRSFQQKQKAQKQAIKILNTKELTKREKILIATCLYWAEGAKRDFSLTNTDPGLIKTFIECLKEFGIEKEKLSINVRIYEDLDKEKVYNFWSKVTGLPKRKIVYVDVLRGKKNGKFPYGMCRLRVIKGAYFLKLIKELQDMIKTKTL